MLGVFVNSLEKIKKEDMYFVSVPDNLPSEEVKAKFSQLAQTFANKIDTNVVYLLYGKETIKYEYSL